MDDFVPLPDPQPLPPKPRPWRWVVVLACGIALTCGWTALGFYLWDDSRPAVIVEDTPPTSPLENKDSLTCDVLFWQCQRTRFEALAVTTAARAWEKLSDDLEILHKDAGLEGNNVRIIQDAFRRRSQELAAKSAAVQQAYQRQYGAQPRNWEASLLERFHADDELPKEVETLARRMAGRQIGEAVNTLKQLAANSGPVPFHETRAAYFRRQKLAWVDEVEKTPYLLNSFRALRSVVASMPRQGQRLAYEKTAGFNSAVR